MKIEFNKTAVIVTSGAGDKPIYGESALWHKIKLALKSFGLDVIKRGMTKDGHMVANNVYYIRERKGKFSIHDSQYAIRDMAYDYRNEGKVILSLTGEIK